MVSSIFGGLPDAQAEAHDLSREFKDEAVKPVTQRGYSVSEVAERLGVSSHSLYKWLWATRHMDAKADELAATKLGKDCFKIAARLSSSRSTAATR